MAKLENATYDEIVTHLERELQLIGLEEGDGIPVPTMFTAPTATRQNNCLFSSGIDPMTTGIYCKKPGHTKDDCRKLKRKEEKERKDGQSTKKSTQTPDLWQKTRQNSAGKALETTSSQASQTKRFRTHSFHTEHDFLHIDQKTLLLFRFTTIGRALIERSLRHSTPFDVHFLFGNSSSLRRHSLPDQL